MSSEVKVNKISPASGTSIVIGDSGDTVSLGSGVSASGFGKVLQVVSTTKTDTASTTSTSWVDISGLSLTITPSSASNKIFLIANITTGVSNTATTAFRFVQDGTEIFVGDQVGSNRNRASFAGHSANVYHLSTPSAQVLAAPNTTSAVTYKIQWIAQGVQTSYLNRGGNYGDTTNSYDSTFASTITAMEIEG
jgi:hypothetical protein